MVDKRQGTRPLNPNPDQPRQLVLAGEPQSARQARQFARDYVMRSEPGAAEDYVDTIVLVTSELVTNSIRYGTEPGDALALTLHTRRGRTRVEVRDPVRRRPQPRPESHKRDRGRGLLILDELCHWGVDDAAFGKVVWAEVIAK
ncbi:Anti-sigma regulatory factor (Ser/Thr protein kinase) [Streptomyces sp. 2224.1]|uniref:ATP-binding protein n=1 Tax=Streptomyces sp. 2224.1 TaxID=1881020 RepID=UPI0008955A81|nr:ATP-binding protein [Streptomyces sp. 2224.1]SEE22077.1 Anti-sigma regulatory factor (Ser/Thr protein kinase) [Streptomyces sp. 2224.1]